MSCCGSLPRGKYSDQKNEWSLNSNLNPTNWDPFPDMRESYELNLCKGCSNERPTADCGCGQKNGPCSLPSTGQIDWQIKTYGEIGPSPYYQPGPGTPYGVSKSSCSSSSSRENFCYNCGNRNDGTCGYKKSHMMTLQPSKTKMGSLAQGTVVGFQRAGAFPTAIEKYSPCCRPQPYENQNKTWNRQNSYTT